MTHFGDCGSHCADPYCLQKDFLPFQCDACGKSYCSTHFRYEAHCCPKGRADKDKRVIVCPICTESLPLPAGDDANAVWEVHAASGKCHSPPPPKPRCPVSGCKEKLTTINSIQCGSCSQLVCMKHRFEDLHECRPQAPCARARRPVAHKNKENNFGTQMKGFWRNMSRLVK